MDDAFLPGLALSCPGDPSGCFVALFLFCVFLCLFVYLFVSVFL